MTHMPIGRFRGKPFDIVPKPYLRWLIRQRDVRPDLLVAIKRHLGILTAPAAVFDFKAAAAGEREQHA